ncbi:MAG: hypothetical protein HKO57_07990 [Akkermansiaceae bacterium]|nr:hypothetical protein [Akkermansiaceae bacterium]
MKPSELDAIYRPLAKHLHHDHMACLGIAPTMRLAESYNECKFAREKAWRDELYRTRFDELLEENGGCSAAPVTMHDGWALDTSMSLPHLDRVLEDSDRIFAERAGRQQSEKGAYRSYFQNVFSLEDAETYPSFLDFATSSDIVSVVGHYLRTIPALSTTLPPGIRLVESNAAFDAEPDRPKDSQLYHIDYYSLPNLYVLVVMEDTTLEHGPWTFLPRGTSQKVRERLGYWGPGLGYRISDEAVYATVDRSEVIPFTYPRGTVLFIESSGCLHYGSRNSIKPRFQLMLGYTGACRTDFSEVFMSNDAYAAPESSPLLRRMVADKYLPAPGRPDSVDLERLPQVQAELGAVAQQVGVELGAAHNGPPAASKPAGVS